MIIIGYIRLNENPHGILVDDCVIRAITTATGRNWDDVYLDLMLEGFEHKNWGNFNAIWWNYLVKKGYKRFLIPDTCPMCYTLKDFIKDHPYGIYIESYSRGNETRIELEEMLNSTRDPQEAETLRKIINRL